MQKNKAWISSGLTYVYTEYETKVGNFCEWSFTLLAPIRPAIPKQFYLSEVKQPLALLATG